MNEVTYSFEELPLLVTDGIECVYVEGEAIIDYNSPLEWRIEKIALYGWMDGPFKIAPIAHTTFWHELIRAALLRHRMEQISDAVLEAMQDA